MYRAPDTTPRCPVCGNCNLSPETRFDPSEGNAQIHFADPSAKPSFLGDPNRSFTLNRARVCLDCGHVALSLGKRKLAELRSALATLHALPE